MSMPMRSAYTVMNSIYEYNACTVSMAGAATSRIFVATKMLLVAAPASDSTAVDFVYDCYAYTAVKYVCGSTILSMLCLYCRKCCAVPFGQHSRT